MQGPRAAATSQEQKEHAEEGAWRQQPHCHSHLVGLGCFSLTSSALTALQTLAGSPSGTAPAQGLHRSCRQNCAAPVAADHEAPSYYDDYDQHYDHHAAEQEESATAAAVDALNAAAQHAADIQQQQHQQQLEQDPGSLLAPLLLVTTVDIGDGKADRIEVRQGDVPLEVANAFVSKHGLPTAVVPRLAMHLEENLLKVEVQRRAAVGACFGPCLCGSFWLRSWQDTDTCCARGWRSLLC